MTISRFFIALCFIIFFATQVYANEQGHMFLQNNGAYSGEISNGMPHGFGTAIWPNGASYEGEWFAGRFHGNGTLIWPDGTGLAWGSVEMIEIRDWFYNFIGQGQRYGGGQTYEGEFVNGIMHGFGIMTFRNGNYQKGGWRNGWLHGEVIRFVGGNERFHELFNEGMLVERLCDKISVWYEKFGTYSFAIWGYVNFIDRRPIKIDGVIYAPVRSIFEAFGYTTEWDAVTQTAILSNNENTITITVGNSFYTINERTHYVDAPIEIIDGRIMMRLACIIDSAGYLWMWRDGSLMFYISTTGSWG